MISTTPPSFVRLALASAADLLAAYALKDEEPVAFDGYMDQRTEHLAGMSRADQEAALAELRDNPHARRRAARRVRRAYGAHYGGDRCVDISVHVYGIGWRDVPAVALRP